MLLIKHILLVIIAIPINFMFWRSMYIFLAENETRAIQEGLGTTFSIGGMIVAVRVLVIILFECDPVSGDKS